MFGIIFKLYLFALVVFTVLMYRDEAVEYSPWGSCRVPMRLIILRPRPMPCKHHRRFNDSRTYVPMPFTLTNGWVYLAQSRSSSSRILRKQRDSPFDCLRDRLHFLRNATGSLDTEISPNQRHRHQMLRRSLH